MPLDPLVGALFAQVAASGRPAISASSPEQARAVLEAGRAALGSGPPLDRVEDVSIATRGGHVPGRLFRPKPRPDGLVVYFHGGGWVLGTLDGFDAVVRVLAERSGCAFLLVDYRLAPETPFPGAVEDAVDALLWAARGIADLAGRDAGDRDAAGRDLPLVAAGDSAGANLATVAAAILRGRVEPALQVLIYPVADCDFDTPSYRDPGNAGIVTRDDMIWFFDHYAAGPDRAGPDVSPLRRPDLAGLPPAHVATAEYDVLRDEGEAYARRLAAAGIATVLRRYDGLPHGFIRLHNLVPAVDAALTEIAAGIGEVCRAAAVGSAAASDAAGAD